MGKIVINKRGRLQRVAEGCRVAQTHLNPIRQGILLHAAASRSGCSERTIFTINRFAGWLLLTASKGFVFLFLLLCGVRDYRTEWGSYSLWYSFTVRAVGNKGSSGGWPLAIISMMSIPTRPTNTPAHLTA